MHVSHNESKTTMVALDTGSEGGYLYMYIYIYIHGFYVCSFANGFLCVSYMFVCFSYIFLFKTYI